MAINPQLLNAIANPAQMKIDDPLEQYGSMLKNAMMTNEMMKDRHEREDLTRLNDAAKAAYGQNGFDPEAYTREMAQRGVGGKNIPTWLKLRSGIAEDEARTRTADATTAKTKVEALLKHHEYGVKRMSGIPTDKNGVRPLVDLWMEQATNPELTALGFDGQKALDFNLKNLNDAIRAESATPGALAKYITGLQMDAKDAYANQYQLVKTAKGQQLVAANAHGDPNPRTVSNYDPAPVGAGTNVTVTNVGPKAANKFGDTLGEERAKDFAAMEKANRSVLQAAPRVDRALQLLDDGVTAGALSGQITDARALAKQFGFNVDDKRLVNTQELRQLLISGAFDHVAQLKAQGVSLTPMTDHDIELLKQSVASGKDDVQTIRRSLLTYRRVLQDINEQYRQQAQQYGESAVGPALKAVPTTPGGPIPDRPTGLSPAAQEYLNGVQ